MDWNLIGSNDGLKASVSLECFAACIHFNYSLSVSSSKILT